MTTANEARIEAELRRKRSPENNPTYIKWAAEAALPPDEFATRELAELHDSGSDPSHAQWLVQVLQPWLRTAATRLRTILSASGAGEQEKIKSRDLQDLISSQPWPPWIPRPSGPEWVSFVGSATLGVAAAAVGYGAVQLITAGSSTVAAASGASAGSSAAADLGGGAAAAASSAGAAAAAAPVTAGVTDALTSAVASISSDVNAIVSPINSFMQGVSNFANEIQNGIIQPILGPIEGTYNAINGLVNALHGDLSSGLSGLARIPEDINQALNSTAAAFQRSVQQLNLQAHRDATDVLAPAIGNAAAEPLKLHAEAIVSGWNGPKQEIPAFSTEQLTSQIRTDVAKGLEETIAKWSRADAPWYERLGYIGYSLMLSAAIVLKKVEVIGEAMNQDANLADPISLLGLGDVVRGYQRGALTLESARAEVGRAGISAERFQVMLDNAASLLPIAQAVQAWQRGELASDALDREASDQGVTAARLTVWKALARVIPGPGDVLQWWLRGIVTEEDATLLLQYNGYSPQDIAAYKESIVHPVPVAAVIQDEPRATAAATGFISSSLNATPPPAVLQAAQANGISADEATIAWRNHWALPAVQTWIEAYHRGLRTRDEVNAALALAAVPQELWDDYIALSSPLPRFTYVIDWLKMGIIDEQQARVYFAQYGYPQDQITNLVAYAKVQAKTAKHTTATTIANVTIATGDTLYKDGVLTREQYVQVLEAHKYDPEAAQLTVELADMQIQASNRKAEVAALKAEVELGNLTLEDMQSQMYRDGFSSVEVDQAVVGATRAKKKAAKNLSEAQYEQLFKKGIIAATDLQAGLESLGYTGQRVLWLMQLYGAYTPPTSAGG